MMGTTISTLLITSLFFLHSIESSSRLSGRREHGASGSSGRPDPPNGPVSPLTSTPLQPIPGLYVPPEGIEIRHDGRILAKLHKRVVLPYLYKGKFAVPTMMLNKTGPHAFIFVPKIVDYDQWEAYICAYAYQKNVRWVYKSAIRTAQAYKIADREVAALAKIEQERVDKFELQRSAIYEERRDNIYRHHHAALERDAEKEKPSEDASNTSSRNVGSSQGSNSGSSRSTIYGSRFGDFHTYLSRLHLGTELPSSTESSTSTSSSGSYRHVDTPRIFTRPP